MRSMPSGPVYRGDPGSRSALCSSRAADGVRMKRRYDPHQLAADAIWVGIALAVVAVSAVVYPSVVGAPNLPSAGCGSLQIQSSSPTIIGCPGPGPAMITRSVTGSLTPNFSIPNGTLYLIPFPYSPAPSCEATNGSIGLTPGVPVSLASSTGWDYCLDDSEPSFSVTWV